MSVDVGSAVAFLDLDTSKFEKGIKSALSSLNTFADKSASMSDRIGGFGSAMSSVGGMLTKNVTLPIATVGGVVTKLASDFDTSMSKVKAISGATGDEMVALRDKAIEMGAKTQFSAKESADAFTYMAMAGWDAGQMIDGIAGIMDLAAADGLDLATTSDIVTDALTAFGLQASDSAHFADVLAQASSSANTNVSMLGESFKYVAPVAGALGMSVEDAALALGLMANSGIKGSQAGTALRTSLTNLVKPTEAMSNVMEDLGIEVENSDGSMKSLRDIMVLLREKFNGLSEAEKANAAATIFGKEAMSGMLAIINTSEEDFNKLADAIDNSDGRAQEMANTMLDNLGGSITLLKSALESLAIKLGSALAPAIKDIADWITKLVEKLNEMDDAQVQQIIQIGAVIASIGPLLGIFGKLLSAASGVTKIFSALSSASGALSALGAAAAPILLVVAAIGSLVAIFVKLYNESEDFRNQINGMWENIQQEVGGAVEKIKGVLETFKEALSIIPKLLQKTFDTNSGKLGEAFVNVINNVRYAIEKLAPIVEFLGKVIGAAIITAISHAVAIVNGFLNALAPLLEIVGNLARMIGDLGGAIVAVFEGDFGSVKDYMDDFWTTAEELVLNAVDAILSYLKGFVDGFWETLTGMFEKFGVDIAGFFEGVGEAISGFIDSVVEWFTNLPNKIYEFLLETINKVIEWKDNMLLKAQETGEKFINNIQEFFEKMPYNIGYIIGYVYQKITDWKDNMVLKAKEMAENFLNRIVEFFVLLPGRIYEFVTDAYNKVVAWKNEMVEKARQMGADFIAKVVEFFTMLPTKIKTYITNAYNNVVQWKNNMVQKSKDTANEFVNELINKIKELPGKVKEKIDEVVNKLKEFPAQFKAVGSDMFNKLWEGMKGVWDSIAGWFEGILNKVKEFLAGITKGMDDAKSASSTASTTSGSHANGLTLVPYDGYIAELHQGERVLTKEETKNYNKPSGGDTFIFNSPKAIDEYEAAKLFKRTKRELLLDV